ncbi:MAG: ATP-binding protein [Myxococcota bacterium]
MATPPPARVRPLARRLILWFVGVALVPLLATVLLSYWSSRDVVAGLLEENLGKTARLYASEVDDFLAEKAALLTALAGGVEAQDAVLAEVVARSKMIEELIVLDATGQVIARSDDHASWAVEACRAQGGIARMQHAHHGGHEVVVAAPRDGGGSLCGRVSFTLHQDMISERARSTFGGLAYIVDRNGDVVCHAFEEDEPHVHPGEPIQGAAAEHARVGEAWHGVVEVDGERRFAAYAPAVNLPWGVWAEVPVDEAAYVLQPMATRALILGGVLTALLAGVILLLVRRIAAPIEELASASQRIAQGAYGETVPVQRDDEVGLLAREFNAMSKALADAVHTLDAKVEERTAELDAARKFSDTLLDTLDHRIVVIGPDRRILKANKAAMDAYGPAIVGCGCSTVHETPEGQTCPAEAFFAADDTAPEPPTERVRRTANGDTEILAVERFPVPGPDGPTALLEIERDVTASKQLQAHLVHQEKMAALGTLAAGLAHEIGNPLASLSSELELLEMDPGSVGDALPVLRDQARRMGVLVRELVDLGRTPTDQRSRFEAEELLDDVARLLRHSARERGVSLSVEADDLTLCSNRDRLVQVLLNLGLNAVDASPREGRIHIRVCGDGERVVFTVADEGDGLPDDTSTLFEPFFTTKAVGQGTGLGLFVVDRLVTALGGQITAENLETGGASFTVELPDCACGSEG